MNGPGGWCVITEFEVLVCVQPTCPRFLQQRVLLFVASDVDALCACKILQVSFEYLRKVAQG